MTKTMQSQWSSNTVDCHLGPTHAAACDSVYTVSDIQRNSPRSLEYMLRPDRLLVVNNRVLSQSYGLVFPPLSLVKQGYSKERTGEPPNPRGQAEGLLKVQPGFRSCEHFSW